MNKYSKELTPPGLRYIANNIIQKENILGSQKIERAAWAKNLKLGKKAKMLFFAGCGYQYSSGLESLMSLIRNMDKSPIGIQLPMSLTSTRINSYIDPASIYRKVMGRPKSSDSQPLVDAVKILRSFGIDLAYLADEEPCCGGALYFAGMENDFINNAVKSYQRIESYGIKQIISIVPSCTYTLRMLFPKYIRSYDFEVRHFLEIVLDNIDKKELRFPRDIKITYHDPCQLSRYLNLIDEPREILKSIEGIHLFETKWTNREWSTCCGGGGGFEAVFPALSGILAVNRARELVDTGAEIIVTHCPGCIMQIRHGLKRLNIKNVEVMDITQIISMAMGL